MSSEHAPSRRRRRRSVRPAIGIGWLPLLLSLLVAVGCGGASGDDAADAPASSKSAATTRAARRLFDGAPPVIPHRAFGIDCVECHNSRGIEVAGVGYAPPTPHELTRGIGTSARCNQCHVFVQTDQVLVANSFRGLPQDLRHGRRVAVLAPPVIPHPVFMRESCASCHSGAAAREPIRTSHPERVRCRQCHLERTTSAQFATAPQ